MKKHLLFMVFYIGFTALAQDCSKINKKAVKRLKDDVYTLASDQMEGRNPGTSGEIKARNYLSQRMQEIELETMGTEGFVQAFSYFEKVKQKPNKTKLSINNKSLKFTHQFYATEFSANGIIEDTPVLSVGFGIHLPQQNYSDYEILDIDIQGYVALIDIELPAKNLDQPPSIEFRISEAKSRGAVGVLLFSSKNDKNAPKSTYNRIKNSGLPVLYLKQSSFDEVPQIFVENTSFSVVQYETPTLAHNIIGFIDNSAKLTVVITAHYDHLGFGSFGSKYKGQKKIHNGADDNASGTAALLELAYFFQNNKKKEKYNFLFIAFSAEEKGLLGSKYFVKNPTLALVDINYVLNMDMVGRMEVNMPLTIEGLGSSLVWETTLNEVSCDAFPLTLKKREDGPSDHAAFFKVGIPALHFWTGNHNDYHLPSDDADKINFDAESQIISFIEAFILKMDEKDPVLFNVRRTI
jgi:hypothetical protein